MLLEEWNPEEPIMENREEAREEIARNALAEGASIEFISRITGLDTATIQQLAAQ
jgi:predicted transposase YdaD